MARIIELGSDREKNFKALYELYYAPFCLYAKRFINDMDVCEDLVADAFVTLWNTKEDILLKEKQQLMAYLRISVKNNCLNYIKHEICVGNYSEIQQAQQENEPIYASSPDSIYTVDELYEMIYKILDKLPPEYKQVFVKSFFEGKTQAEIADELNLSTKSVGRYKQKTLELLRGELKDFLPLFLLLMAMKY